MNLETLELIAWDLDPSPHRPSRIPHVPTLGRDFSIPSPTVIESSTNATDFAQIQTRPDLHEEFAGLDWSLAVVDLRTLQAFQRRLHFDPTHPTPTVNPNSLLTLAFPPPRPTTHTRPTSTTIQSPNPDLTLRPTFTGWQLHGGSPFLEVALFQHRAFLRDGYHRAHDLLRAGLNAVPAVVIHARTLDEIYPQTPNFFPESTTFAPRPPMVTDFLDPTLTLSYPTPRVLKTIRISIQESFEPEIKELHP
ncbi:hypothetical protein [Granulicella tundricola]|uniref:Uncharacterized protein n=1 Tax=Granulicella tundricola (strain ATCC BAA-1859 / DSM 23138 / MP5ACTX9) TaxID=1198114 RepID=E8X1D2_GRATM|nr:hypothetical protein [Granulicella tundricola]ADW69086.1 hypothetical protein AciX9_2041 [Granulicella tundricola MP5ACTX9]